MSMKILEYKDHNIIYKNAEFLVDGTKEGFYIEAPELGPFEKLTHAKLEIDRLAKIKYVPEHGWRFAGRGWRSSPELGGPPSEYEILNVMVTSPHKVGKEPSPDNSFWVKHENGKREVRTDIYARCPENDQLIPKIVGRAAEAHAALADVEKMIGQLIPVAIPQQKA